MASISRENRRALRILRPLLEQIRLMSTKPEDRAKADWKFQFNKTKSATSPQKYPENTNQPKGPFSLNGKAHISLANEALFGPVIKTNQKQNSTLSFEEIVECDSSEESDGGSDYWTDRVSGEDVRNRSRDQLLHQHQQQHDLFKALSESGNFGSEEQSQSKTEIVPIDSQEEYNEIVEVNYAEETSPQSSLLPPAINPEVHPMVNRLRPVLSTEDAASEVVGTIRHSRKEGYSKAIPSVTKILKETMPAKQRAILQAWEDRMVAQMGRAAFEEMTQKTFHRGERFHSIIDQHLTERESLANLLTSEDDEVTANHVRSVASVINRFGLITTSLCPPLAIESSVVHPDLGYQGYMDCVALYQPPLNARNVKGQLLKSKPKLMLIDWKTAGKTKRSIGQTYDNPLQVAAYVGAFNHDARYPVRLEEGMIVVVYNDGSPATVFPITKGRLNNYWSMWLKRLALYKHLKQANL